MNKGAVIWATGCTVDSTLHLPLDDLTKYLAEAGDIIEAYCREHNLTLDAHEELPRRFSDAIKNIAVPKDMEIRFPDRDTFLVARRIAAKYAPEETWMKDLGGTPAIAALSGMLSLARKRGNNDYLESYYSGVVPNSALHALLDTERYSERIANQFVTGNHLSKHIPETIGVELDDRAAKIMLSWQEGRNIADLKLERFLDFYCMDADLLISGWAGFNKGTPENYAALWEGIKRVYKNAFFFGETNSFKKPEDAKQLVDLVAYRADFWSGNEAELEAQVMGIYGSAPQTAPDRLNKLKEYLDDLREENKLESPQTLMVHTAGGLIILLDDALIGHDQALEQFRKKLDKAALNGVGAASYYGEHGEYGTSPQISHYVSKAGNAESNHDLFEKTMGVKVSELPGEMIGIPSIKLSEEAHGSITGAGSRLIGAMNAHMRTFYETLALAKEHKL